MAQSESPDHLRLTQLLQEAKPLMLPMFPDQQKKWLSESPLAQEIKSILVKFAPSSAPTRSQNRRVKRRPCRILRLARSEVLDDRVRFPAKRLVRVIRIYLFPVQRHSFAGLDAACVAGERVNSFVAFVRQAHPIVCRTHASRNHPRLIRSVRSVNQHDHNDHGYYHSRNNPIQCGMKFTVTGERGFGHRSRRLHS